MRKINEIIVHCSATPSGMDVGVSEITRWHIARGWAGCGYHYVVRLDGRIEAGRPLEQVGAHCVRHNAHSVGVCYVGGLSADCRPADTRTPAQRRALRKLLHELRKRFGGVPVHGHRDFAAKACPCFDASQEYRDV